MDIFLSQQEVCKIVPYSRQQMLRLENNGKFPKRVKLGAKRIAWRKSDIEKYIREA